MRVRYDSAPALEAPPNRCISLGLGLITFGVLDFGWSASLRGRLLGRLKLPVVVPGYLWIEIKVFGLVAVFGSYQLS